MSEYRDDVPPNLPDHAIRAAMKAFDEIAQHIPDGRAFTRLEIETILRYSIRTYLMAVPRPVLPKPKSRKKASAKERKLHVLKRDGYQCYLCGLEIVEEDASLDHVVPRSKGGVNALKNIRAAHKACNLAKGDLPLDEFLALQKLKAQPAALRPI